MILSVHALFGSAVASLVPAHPAVGFTLGFVSHLLLDAIPHQDYRLLSFPEPKEKSKIAKFVYHKYNLLQDIILVSLDAVVGIFLAFVFFFNISHPYIFLIGAVGGMLPDFLTFLYFILRYKILLFFYNIHSNFFHSKKEFKFKQIIAIFLQYFVVVTLIVFISGIKIYTKLFF